MTNSVANGTPRGVNFLTKSLLVGAISMALALPSQALQLQSQDIRAGQSLSKQQVFNGFGCQGDNISPQLEWRDVPKGTQSYAITVYDPDAPTGSGWWHWVAFNIPADVQQVPADAGNPARQLMPEGVVQSRTDYGSFGFGGACPPEGHGDHRYQFTLHALDVSSLPLGPDSSAALVGYMLGQHSLATSQLQVTYGR